MAKSKSSHRWLQEHFNDHYVKQAKREGWLTRASYKLLEIQEKDHIFKPGMRVIDLGAAPGGWSQVAAKMVGKQGYVVASDILCMQPLENVDFIQGDFTEEAVLSDILNLIGEKKVDLVISDMAPNISGIAAVDQASAMLLTELALDFARCVLKQKGLFLVKVFHGSGFDSYLKDMRLSFSSVRSRKPMASRPRSREHYLLGKNFKT